VTVADKAPCRFVLPRTDARDHQAGQKPVRDCQGNYAGIEIAQRDTPFLRQGAQRIRLVGKESVEIPGLDAKAFRRLRRQVRRAELGEPGHDLLDRRGDFGTPFRVEKLDAKQFGRRRHQLLLHRQQCLELDRARVQLNFDQSIIGQVHLDETAVLYREGNAFAVAVELSERGKELFRLGCHPLALRGHQHGRRRHHDLLAPLWRAIISLTIPS